MNEADTCLRLLVVSKLHQYAGWDNELCSIVKLRTLKRYQADTATELNTLLPAVLDQGFRGAL